MPGRLALPFRDTPFFGRVDLRRPSVAGVACSCTIAAGSWPAPAPARDVVVRSFDGTPIVAHFYPAPTASAAQRAPTVLVGAGYPQHGDRRPALDASDQIGTATLRAAGYNVLTWDPRGLGGSGGTVMFGSPAYEARDVAALVGFVAAQPEALLDAAGDPRLGMSGRSYGGGIQLVSAATDPRIDAIVPDLAWNSLVTSLFTYDAVKSAWLAAICGAGEVSALADGLFFGGAGLQLGGTATELKRACVEGVAGGTVSAATRRWFAERGPGELVDRIRAPTLLTQGTVDTLFGLKEAAVNYERLRAGNTPVKMMWYHGGHGERRTVGDPRYVSRRALAWLDRWLKRDPTVDTGPSFEWLADDGIWRSGPDFPLASAGALRSRGTAALQLWPLHGADMRAAPPRPVPDAASIGFPAPPAEGDVLGAPRVKLVYSGIAVPMRGFLYAQVVDATRGRVVGSQVTPIAVILDGTTRSVERTLEVIALRARPGSDLRLQLVANTSVYRPQAMLGRVRLHAIEASLPLVDATRAARPPADARRLPLRLRIAVALRREGRTVRISLRSKLRSRPCAGKVRFTIRASGTRRAKRVAVAASCAVRAVARVPARAGRTVRVGARFEGNDQLLPRRARSVLRRLR